LSLYRVVGRIASYLCHTSIIIDFLSLMTYLNFSVIMGRSIVGFRIALAYII